MTGADGSPDLLLSLIRYVITSGWTIPLGTVSSVVLVGISNCSPACADVYTKDEKAKLKDPKVAFEFRKQLEHGMNVRIPLSDFHAKLSHGAVVSSHDNQGDADAARGPATVQATHAGAPEEKALDCGL